LLKHILLVEDDPEVAWLVGQILPADTYRLSHVSSGPAALEHFQSQGADLVILDVRLPGLDGLSVCRELRRQSWVPILMLSGQDRPIDKVLGIEIGADDYITKPFHPDELLARVRAQLRRPKVPSESDWQQFGDLEVCLPQRRVRRGGQEVSLTLTEFGLLSCLLQRPGQVWTRQQLLDQVWGSEFAADERTVDAHIRNLRAKLRPHDAIASVRGVGYRFVQG
jgi:two-component system response regulator MtrA